MRITTLIVLIALLCLLVGAVAGIWLWEINSISEQSLYLIVGFWSFLAFAAMALVLMFITLDNDLARMTYASSLLRQSRRWHRAQSHTDPLTRLPNRRRFEHDLCRGLYAEAERPAMLAILELDALGALRAICGRVTVNEAIAVGAALIWRRVSSLGILYRIEDDQFAILAAESDWQAVEAALLHLQRMLQHTSLLPNGNGKVRLGFHACIVLVGRDESADALIARSALLLDEARAARKGCVVSLR